LCGHRAKCKSGGIGSGRAGKRPGRVDIGSDGEGTESDSVDIGSCSVGYRARQYGHRAKYSSVGTGSGGASTMSGRFDIGSEVVGTVPDSVDVGSDSIGHRL
jgi:hypothetical protein